MKRILEGNHGGALGVGARNLDGVFHGFRAGIDEHRFLGPADGSQGIQFFGEGDIGLVGSHAKAEMQETVHLIVNGLRHQRVAVADIQAPNATGKIEVAIPVDVFDPCAFRLSPRRWA